MDTIEQKAEKLLTEFDGFRTTEVQEILRRAMELSGSRSVFKASLDSDPALTRAHTYRSY